MTQWYTVCSFVTNSTYPTMDLTAFFSIAGIADVHLQNVTWRLVEVAEVGAGQFKFSGTVDADGTLQPDPAWTPQPAPPYVFHGLSYDGYLELQVGYTPSTSCLPGDDCDCDCSCTGPSNACDGPVGGFGSTGGGSGSTFSGGGMLI